MVRLSTTLLPTNIDGVLKVDVVNIDPIPIIPTDTLPVNDAEANSTLTSIDNKISKGAETILTEAQQVLCYGEVTSGPGIGELHPIHITNAGDIEVEIADFKKGQELMAGSFPVVIASDQSTLPISVSTLPLPSGASTEATLSAINNKITFGDANTLGDMQCVGIYAERNGGAWAQLQTDNDNNLKITNDNITKGAEQSLTDTQQVGLYGWSPTTSAWNRVHMTDTGVLKVDRDYKRTSTTETLTIPDSICQNTVAIDMNQNGNIAIYGTTNNVTNLGFWIQYSKDGVTFYQGNEPDSIITINPVTGDFFQQTEVIAPYVRIRRCNTSGASETFVVNFTIA